MVAFFSDLTSEKRFYGLIIIIIIIIIIIVVVVVILHNLHNLDLDIELDKML